MTAPELPSQWLGVYPDMDENVYHSKVDILSSSGARSILPPSCPAEFKWQLEHRTERKCFDVGHAAHTLKLGVGSELVEIDAPDFRTKAAQQARDEAYAAGKVPLLSKDLRTATDMADALSRHRLADELLTGGTAEASLFWRDIEDVTLRARPDYASEDWSTIVDVKTTAGSASPEAFAKACLSFGYHQQDDWYRQGVIGLGLHPNPDFVFVVVSKTPPHLVSVIRLDEDTRDLAYHLNRKAIALFASCQRLDLWPDFGQRVHTVGLPGWALRQSEGVLDTDEAVF